MIKNYSRPHSSMFMSFNVDSTSFTLRFSKNAMPLFNPIYENQRYHKYSAPVTEHPLSTHNTE
ncbi:hypothetical protein M422DRAFT_32841 [Sphaerobolus stellatus SS14]|uniref:Uncharacterized protein n=1 Tax=Sphaerobolus stellatus (strain SS14) TaxID=990650 RepID=A0A0C9U846_SPHS4|nr:hypothetical protein M422DRAFT_32841 [Sphaerobolus stellatus SS14]